MCSIILLPVVSNPSSSDNFISAQHQRLDFSRIYIPSARSSSSSTSTSWLSVLRYVPLVAYNAVLSERRIKQFLLLLSIPSPVNYFITMGLLFIFRSNSYEMVPSLRIVSVLEFNFDSWIIGSRHDTYRNSVEAISSKMNYQTLGCVVVVV